MAIDIGSLAAVGSALRSAGEIMKTMVGLRDGVLLQAKAIELNAEIITAQGAALTAKPIRPLVSSAIIALQAVA